MVKKYTLGSFCVNTYFIIINNDVLVVDPGEGIEEIIDEFKEYNIVGVLLTHGHVDHIAGLKSFKCPIYINKLDNEFLFNSSMNLYAFADFAQDYSRKDLNIVEINGNGKIEIETFEVNYYHTPGHTKGSMCYLVQNKIFTGDTLFKESVGRTDFPTGSRVELDKSLAFLMKSFPNNMKVYPGHDEITTIGYEKLNNPFINKRAY